MVRQKCFEIECDSVFHVAHVEARSLCQEVTENSECDFKCIDTLKCKAVDVKIAVEICELRTQIARCSSIDCKRFTHFCGAILPGLCCLQLQIWIFFERIVLQQERVLLEV